MIIADIEVSLVDSMGSDLSVVNAARVSFAKESDWDETLQEREQVLKYADEKLITYLATHNHWSPFAHAFLSLRIKAPIFVARQLVKHQVGLAWNEVSRRYVDDEPEFYFPREWRGKPVNAKQGSTGTYDYQDAANEDLKFITKNALEIYNRHIAQGMAPEQARMYLPFHCMTEWIWSGSLFAFARVCNLRLDPHAQQETQDVAIKIASLAQAVFPASWKALVDDKTTID